MSEKLSHAKSFARHPERSARQNSAGPSVGRRKGSPAEVLRRPYGPPQDDKQVAQDDGVQFHFHISSHDSRTEARTGIIHTSHGSFETPAFMPVATKGTVKALTPRDLHEAGARILLANAYHLWIRPGTEVLRKCGGLHRFMGWAGPILTDSGGYQVFSLSRIREISEEGVRFHSPVDGKEVFLSPETAVEIQEILASDIAMVLDDCPPPTRDRARIQRSLNLTLHWSRRAKKRHRLEGQALFGIVQGGFFEDLRLESLARTVEMGFDGYALGGLCVGESKEQTVAVLDAVLPQMPKARPRYLMGVGRPLDFLEAVDRGADLFDSVTPTRYGRNGAAFTPSGLIVVRNGKYRSDERPLQEDCACYACRHFSRAYLRHLCNTEEMLGPQLVSLHNVFFFMRLFERMRERIRAGAWSSFQKDFANFFDPECR